MDSTKQLVGSDVENDQPEKVDEEDDNSIGTGRSYECAFCKRGFTNAQALGGHMNIHRKDKAKAKQLITHQSSSTSPSTNKSSELDYTKSFSPISSTEQEHYYYSTLGGQMNYQRYFPASTNPSFPHTYRPNFEFPSVGEDEDLRLGIGPPRMEEGEEKKEDDEEERSRKGNEVDLELRLGHRP